MRPAGTWQRAPSPVTVGGGSVAEVDEPGGKPDPVPAPADRRPGAAIPLGTPLPAPSSRRPLAGRADGSGLPGSSGGQPSGAPCLALLRVGFTEPRRSPGALVVSYTTVSPLPLPAGAARGGLFSVALSRGSPRVGVTHHPALWSPDFPRRAIPRPTRPPARLVQAPPYSRRGSDGGAGRAVTPPRDAPRRCRRPPPPDAPAPARPRRPHPCIAPAPAGRASEPCPRCG